ncbi:alanyl-tRNA editing protein [Sulfitobacter aestuarii]|uniref:Alanyl-tRNA editing protein n=1 Tax=Sulfitobacter aestuarii TaxID=2161676 RepID=A0ABW5U5Q5_9RHOB
MTELLFRTDPYRREARGQVQGHTGEGGVILDATLFYPAGGGQPGDSGWLAWDNVRLPIATAVRGPENSVVLVPGEPQPLPPVGALLSQSLDWERRHRHMRVHTALHLLSMLLPHPVSGGQISASHGRLDLQMPEPPPDRAALEHALNAHVAADRRVGDFWIDRPDLAAQPRLARSLATPVTRGERKIRLVRIGDEGAEIDLQPCVGTHVERTGEIGALRLGRIENRGADTRRVYLHLDG